MREEHGLSVITEVRDATHVDEVIEHSDIIQIGAKAMYDQGILRACAKIKKPVLLKRGFGSTLQEFVQAAEFILSGGNRSEEHTSELQSRPHLVCRLLLEKKKKTGPKISE